MVAGQICCCEGHWTFFRLLVFLNPLISLLSVFRAFCFKALSCSLWTILIFSVFFKRSTWTTSGWQYSADCTFGVMHWCADILYMNNLQTGSILDYTLAYLGAILARVRDKWDAPSKTGLIEITSSREYYRIYSGIQFVSGSILVLDWWWC